MFERDDYVEIIDPNSALYGRKGRISTHIRTTYLIQIFLNGKKASVFFSAEQLAKASPETEGGVS